MPLVLVRRELMGALLRAARAGSRRTRRRTLPGTVESTVPVYRYFTGTLPVRVDQISSTVRVNTGWTGIGPVCAPRDKVFDVRG